MLIKDRNYLKEDDKKIEEFILLYILLNNADNIRVQIIKIISLFLTP